MTPRQRGVLLGIAITSGMAFNLGWFFDGYIWNHFLMLGAAAVLGAGVLYVVLLPWAVWRAFVGDKTPIFAYTVLAVMTACVMLYDEEWFKSDVVLRAWQDSDPGANALILRADETWELESFGLLGVSSKYGGRYVRHNDTLIFKDRPACCLADTGYVVGSNLVFSFTASGEPNMAYSQYFKIREMR